jgi:hypothetical protein
MRMGKLLSCGLVTAPRYRPFRSAAKASATFRRPSKDEGRRMKEEG